MIFLRLFLYLYELLQSELPLKARASLYNSWQQLARAGISPVEAMETVSKVDRRLKPLAACVAQGASQGLGLAEALKPVAAQLGPMPLAMISASELTGRLDQALLSLSKMTRAQLAEREQLLAQLSTVSTLVLVCLVCPPALVLGFSAEVVADMVERVQHMLTPEFLQHTIEAAPLLLRPAVTLFGIMLLLLSLLYGLFLPLVGMKGAVLVALVLSNLFWALLVGSCAVLGAVMFRTLLPGPAYFLSTLVPIYGTWRRARAEAQAFSAMSAALGAGLTVPEVAPQLESFLPGGKGARLARLLESGSRDGLGPSHALDELGMLSPEDAVVLRTAEETGSVEEAFENLAEARRDGVAHHMERFTRAVVLACYVQISLAAIVTLFLVLKFVLMDALQM